MALCLRTLVLLEFGGEAGDDGGDGGEVLVVVSIGVGGVVVGDLGEVGWHNVVLGVGVLGYRRKGSVFNTV
jgi:hypothetical protein